MNHKHRPTRFELLTVHFILFYLFLPEIFMEILLIIKSTGNRIFYMRKLILRFC